MPGKTHIKSSNKAKQKTAHTYNLLENPIEFYISEETSAYEKERPFTIYYDNLAHSVRLLKGDCIEILIRQGKTAMTCSSPIPLISSQMVELPAMPMANLFKWRFNLGGIYGSILAIT